MATNRLTAAQIKAAKPGDKPFKLTDGGGLYLLVNPDGRRFWRYRFVLGGSESMASLGEYPAVTLAAARTARIAAAGRVAAGVSPVAEKREAREALADRFDAIADAYAAEHFAALDPDTARNERKRLEYLREQLAGLPLAKIASTDLATAIRAIKDEHGHDGARRCHGLAERIWSRAVLLGDAPANPASGFKARDALGDAKSKSHPGIVDPKRFAELLKAVNGYGGQLATRIALQVQARVFVRPGKELLKATWSEFDLDAGLWTIPAERMKMKREHLVPLSTQVVALLRELHKLTSGAPFVFAGLMDGKPLSENTLNGALRRLDFDTRAEHCSHGFRASARTMLRERCKLPIEVIEFQLAHAKPGLGDTYDRAQYLDERVALMQRWSDYLDAISSK
jgi:integrase